MRGADQEVSIGETIKNRNYILARATSSAQHDKEQAKAFFANAANLAALMDLHSECMQLIQGVQMG